MGCEYEAHEFIRIDVANNHFGTSEPPRGRRTTKLLASLRPDSVQALMGSALVRVFDIDISVFCRMHGNEQRNRRGAGHRRHGDER